MHETPVRSEVEVTKPQEGGLRRRIVEEFDSSQPEIRQAIKGAYRVLLKYRPRRLSEQPLPEEER
jgi:hypothetical protein